MKLAISGKGGVGKTTVSALLARRLAEQGRRVLAVDADPNANLAATLGFPRPERIVPLVEMKELVAERMGADPDAAGTYFRLNPKVDDLPARYCHEHDGVKLVVMGAVKRGGSGCMCPANAFVKALLDHVLLGPDEAVLVDTEAGLEHFGRGTAQAVDGVLVVVEPALRSIETLGRIRKLAGDLGIRRCWPLANKVGSPQERAFLRQGLAGEPIGLLPYSEAIARAGRGEGSLREVEPQVNEETDAVLERLEAALGSPGARPAGPPYGGRG